MNMNQIYTFFAILGPPPSCLGKSGLFSWSVNLVNSLINDKNDSFVFSNLIFNQIYFFLIFLFLMHPFTLSLSPENIRKP